MVRIIIQDMITASRLYIPYSVVTGIIALAAGCIIWRLVSGTTLSKLIKHNYKKLVIIYITYIYSFCVAFITFFSREPGTREGLDLRLFSTFSAKFSDNIFPVENVILFIPFGILLPLLWKSFRHLLNCLAAAFLFSLAIETSQYITKRGYFQIDDIVTNVLGSLIGYIIIWIFLMICRKQK